eukprot:SAG31_NODE_18778_length_623_cov_0.811069_1_plen_185_part_10
MGSGGDMSRGLIRPVFDTIYCTALLVRARMPPSAVFAIFGYGLLMFASVKLLQPDFSYFTSERERRTGEFRRAHHRIKASAESIALIGGGAVEKSTVDRKLDAVLSIERIEQDKRMLWRPVSMFLTWSAPACITSGLRMVWSQGYGDDSVVMSKQGGTDLSSTGEYVQLLVNRSFMTFGSLLQVN